MIIITMVGPTRMLNETENADFKQWLINNKGRRSIYISHPEFLNFNPLKL